MAAATAADMLTMLTFRPENNTVSSASWEMFCGTPRVLFQGAAFGEANPICASQLTMPTVSISTIASFSFGGLITLGRGFHGSWSDLVLP